MEILRRHNVSDEAIEHAGRIATQLNEFNGDDPNAVRMLLSISVPCSVNFADNPLLVTNQLYTESSAHRPAYTISVLGFINGLVDENLAITYDGVQFRVAVRDSHPDNIQFLD